MLNEKCIPKVKIFAYPKKSIFRRSVILIHVPNELLTRQSKYCNISVVPVQIKILISGFTKVFNMLVDSEKANKEKTKEK